MFSWANHRNYSIYFIWIIVTVDISGASRIYTSQKLAWFSYPFHSKILIIYLSGYRLFRQILSGTLKSEHSQLLIE